MSTHYDRETLIDYLHGALDADTDAAVFAHLQRCSECRAVHDDEAALGELLRSAARAQERELPAMVKARVWDTLRQERPTLAQRLFGGWGAKIAVPVAAAVALGVYFGVPGIRGTSAPQPGLSAIYYLSEHDAQLQQNPLGPGVRPAVYTSEPSQPAAAAASYIDTADAATIDDADGAVR
jgi:hypothetical protein